MYAYVDFFQEFNLPSDSTSIFPQFVRVSPLFYFGPFCTGLNTVSAYAKACNTVLSQQDQTEIVVIDPTLTMFV